MLTDGDCCLDCCPASCNVNVECTCLSAAPVRLLFSVNVDEEKEAVVLVNDADGGRGGGGGGTVVLKSGFTSYCCC